MTLIIGVRCAEGVVLAADSAATMGSGGGQTAQLRTAKKLTNCKNRLIAGVSGHMGLGQRLIAALDDGYAAGSFKGRPEVAVGKMREALVPIVRPEYEMAQLVVGASRNPSALSYANFAMLVALPLEKEPQLVQFTETCSPELANPGLPFACIGSGQSLADPFLAFVRRLFWPASGYPSLQDGILGVSWTMRHAIETNAGGVGGDVQMMTLQREGEQWKARELTRHELDGHNESMNDLERYIGDWRAQFSGSPTSPPPATPPE